VEPANDDTPTQAGSPVLARVTPDPTIESSNRSSTPPGAYEGGYTQPSASLDVIETTLRPAENGRAYLGASPLGSLMDIQYDSGLETEFGCGSGTTPRTVTGSISELFYVIAFSHLSRPRCASPSIAPNISGAPPPPGQTDLLASCTADSPDVNSSVFSPTFVRPVSPLPPSSPGFINDYSGSDGVTIPLFPLPSSPVPSSSPPTFFTSSPTRLSLYNSPPTSPGPEKPTAGPSREGPNLLKRPHRPDMMAAPAGDQGGVLGEGTSKKRVRYHAIAELMLLTLPLEAEHTRPPSTDTEHAYFSTPRVCKTQDPLSITRDNCDEGLPSI